MSLASDLRRALSRLGEYANADLRKILDQVDGLTAAAYDGDDRAKAQLAAALRDLLPGLSERYMLMASAVGADLYDEDRERVAAKGSFRAEPANLGSGGAEALAGWAVNTAKRGETLPRLLEGGMTKRIMQAGNQTIMGASIADPASDGWQRATRAGACYFCRMLAARGAVYSEETVDFAAHDTDHCIAVTAWRDQSRYVKPFTPSPVGTSAAERRLAREWIADHPDLVAADAVPRIGKVTRDGVKLKEHEINSGDRLAALGHDVRFRKTEKQGRNPDVFLDDEPQPWEMKSPEGNSETTIRNQFRNASDQASRLVLDLTRTDRDQATAMREARAAFETYTGLREVLVIVERDRQVDRLALWRR